MTIIETMIFKKLQYRSNNRGTKETCHILGRFAQIHLQSFNDKELNLYSQFLDESDLDILEWLTDKKAPPAPYHNLVVRIKNASI